MHYNTAYGPTMKGASVFARTSSNEVPGMISVSVMTPLARSMSNTAWVRDQRDKQVRD